MGSSHSKTRRASLDRDLLRQPHIRALQSPYVQSTVVRTHVPQEKIPWNVEYSGYRPVEYTAPVVLAGPVWADPATDLSKIEFNTGSRASEHGVYAINDQGRPVNPRGRTGMSGRGLLGRWGPNKAADPILTRWCRHPISNQVLFNDEGKPRLEMVVILRRDTNEWAIPGGMVDNDEEVTQTLKREFSEEALNSLESEHAKAMEGILKTVFSPTFPGRKLIYKGYVDDPRNTDNAWMETTAVNMHDESGHILAPLKLQAGDDATHVTWREVTPDLKLFASHKFWVDQVVAMRREAFAK